MPLFSIALHQLERTKVFELPIFDPLISIGIEEKYPIERHVYESVGDTTSEEAEEHILGYLSKSTEGRTEALK